MRLSKKRSQEKSHKVRGQSDMCHTSVIFTPVFPWQQMGGKFSRRLVSTLSYLLYTHIYAKNFSNVNNFKSTEFEIPTSLNFEFPNKAEIHCSSLPPQRTTASSLSQRMATSLSRSTAGILPLSRWHPPPLTLASSLSRWHPPSLDERLPSILFR